MSRVYNFIFSDVITSIVSDLMKREILEDEFILYYNFFRFLIENPNAVNVREIKRLGYVLSKAKLKSNNPLIDEKINEFKETFPSPPKNY